MQNNDWKKHIGHKVTMNNGSFETLNIGIVQCEKGGYCHECKESFTKYWTYDNRPKPEILEE